MSTFYKSPGVNREDKNNWNSAFATVSGDQLTSKFLNLSGDTMTGKLIVSSDGGVAPFNIGSTGTPSSKEAGDIWRDDGKLYTYNTSGYVKQIKTCSNSVGAIESVSITQTSSSTISAGSINAFLYSLSGWTGDYGVYTVPSITGLELENNSINYLIINQNNGSPIYQITSSPVVINSSNIILAATMSREDDEIHWLPVNWGQETATRLNNKDINVQRFTRTSGLTLGEAVTGGNVITISNGVVYYGISIFNKPAVDSVNNCHFYYRTDSTTWVNTLVSTYNNTNYQTASSGLGTLSNNNRYAVNWVYRYVNGENVGTHQIAYILGGGNYTLGEALDAPLPSSIPTILNRMAILVGRIIVAKNGATAYSITSSFVQTFQGSAIINHNNLDNLQGGTIDEYYHLSNNEHTSVQSGINNWDSTYTTVNANSATWDNIVDITSEPTGFVSPESVIVTYDQDTRQVTLSGTVSAYYKGTLVEQISSGMVSPAHATDNGTYFLQYHPDTGVVFNTDAFEFTNILMAIVYKGNTTFCLRETHGVMQWQTHKHLHETIGTYLKSGGDLGDYTLNSTTAANRRPTINETTIIDEDLSSVLPLLNTSTYSHLYLSGSNTSNVRTDNNDIISLNVNVPFYNQFTGGNWVQTPFANNQYGKIFVMAVPVSNDADGQKVRYLFVQPQQVSTSIATIRAVQASSLNLGDLVSGVAEFCFIGEIIVRLQGGNWIITEANKLLGTKLSQISTPGGNFLSVVSTDNETISGDGTTGNPLFLLPSNGDFTNVSISAQNLILTDAVFDIGGSYIGTGMYLTLNINGSALLIPLYK